MVKNKKEAFKLWKRTRDEQDREEYNNLNKISKLEVSKAKDKAYKQLYRDIKENGPKKIYKLAKTRQRRAKDIDQLNFVKDKEGKIMCEYVKIKEGGGEYFNTLLNTKNNRNELPQTDPVQGPIENIKDAEVILQREKMAANKAQGPDELPIELVKIMKGTGIKWMTSCLREFGKSGKVRKSKITPIYKEKGNPLSCGNYRGIKLLSHSLKLWERVIEARKERKINHRAHVLPEDVTGEI